MKRYLTLITLSFLSTATCANAGRGFDMQAVLGGDPYEGLGALRVQKTALKKKSSDQKNKLLANGYAQKLTAIKLAQEVLRVTTSKNNPNEVDFKLQSKSAILQYEEARKLNREVKNLQRIFTHDKPIEALERLAIKESILQDKHDKASLAKNSDLANGYAQKLTAIGFAQEVLGTAFFGYQGFLISPHKFSVRL